MNKNDLTTVVYVTFHSFFFMNTIHIEYYTPNTGVNAFFFSNTRIEVSNNISCDYRGRSRLHFQQFIPLYIYRRRCGI